jgi:hypothetical protein
MDITDRRESQEFEVMLVESPVAPSVPEDDFDVREDSNQPHLKV